VGHVRAKILSRRGVSRGGEVADDYNDVDPATGADEPYPDRTIEHLPLSVALGASGNCQQKPRQFIDRFGARLAKRSFRVHRNGPGVRL
jgi:hypothetical protein